jgi:hypothetical protein
VKPATIAVAVAAALALAVMDVFVVMAAFVSEPLYGGWLLVAGLAGAGLGLVFRQPWLIVVAQNGVMSLSIIHAVRGERTIDMPSLLYFIALILFGNLLVWPIARIAGRRGADSID